MVEEPARSNNNGEMTPEGDPTTRTNRGWVGLTILFTIVVVAIIAFFDLSATGILSPQEPTQPASFITIHEPVEGALLDVTWAVPVKGGGGGLFEGNVIVQALTASGELLSQQVTIIDSPEAGTGGSGPWSVDLQIIAPPGTQGQIVAFSTSPVDGSIVVEDRINIGYGENPANSDLVKPENHLWNLVELNGRVLIDETRITLQFENFQAFGLGGCNNYNTSYERSGNRLNFGIVTSTAKECEEPEGILAQESAYYDGLEQVVSYQVDNWQMNMFDHASSQLLTYDAVVIGRIISENEQELPEDSVIIVQLNDVSLADVEAEPIAEQIISGVTQFPIPYMVKYNPRQIVENHTYAVGVRVEDSEGNLLFINPAAYQVITNGNPSLVDIMVEAVR